MVRYNCINKTALNLALCIGLFCSSQSVFAAGVQQAELKPENTQTTGETVGARLGTVHFPVSCNTMARRHTTHGLALLHHMTYEDARAAFTAAVENDPDCAMGYWGQAMSFIHPLWSDQPSKVEFEQGLSAVKNAKTRGKKTDWEQAFIDAVEAYYEQGRGASEKDNLASFEQVWKDVYRQFPENPEAATFYALAHISVADRSDQNYTAQKQAAQIARQVLNRIPDHPGAHHYIIHAYDYPLLAENALAVARSYGAITSNVSHAFHMPSHIFTRLGLWQESIAMNQRAAEAARVNPVNSTVSLHYLHALDYLAYAYLQQADDDRAKEVLDTIRSLKMPVQEHFASAYALAAIPARFSLERQQWAEAAVLEPGFFGNFPWNQFPAMEAITHFARALGAARSGNEPIARQAHEQLKVLRAKTAENSKQWAETIEIKWLSAKAWLAYCDDKTDKALKLMKQAADLEAATEKHPVTPGAILPATELLADMYLETGQYANAQKQYQEALKHSPNRFNSLYGAARAAELAGDKVTATEFYRKLVNSSGINETRTRLQQARKFLENL